MLLLRTSKMELGCLVLGFRSCHSGLSASPQVTARASDSSVPRPDLPASVLCGFQGTCPQGHFVITAPEAPGPSLRALCSVVSTT